MRISSILMGVTLILAISACTHTKPNNAKPDSINNTKVQSEKKIGAKSIDVYVAGNKHHISVIFETNTLKADQWAEFRHLKQYKYIDASWGERNYSTAKGEPGILTIWGALFLKTKGVVVITGFDERPQFYEENGRREWRSVALNQNQLNQMIALINSKFLRDENNNLTPIQKNKWGDGFIYPSVESYSLANLCGGWVHRLLDIAEIPRPPFGTFWPMSFMRHIREFSSAYEPSAPETKTQSSAATSST